ncbi:class I SAM-dependent methyltransferase [Patescibacteria group bacterium]|nr:class I SAM-dependent methyltransferase [Patescibacteria group bacterium]MCL5798125.1 class I SAM-dependent methyltransferase [Patescibacteria group bacterium]
MKPDTNIKTILGRIYRVRYPKEIEFPKEAIWKVLCHDWLQKFVGRSDTVLDIAAGHCEFINNIVCGKKFAVDLDNRIKKYANPDVQIFIRSAEDLPKSLKNKVDVVFMGCFLEHLPSKQAIIKVLLEIKSVLRDGGKLIILNPNIRFSTSDYWDYFDHITPVSDRSMVEILQALGFKIEICLPRFVPNTLKDRLPKSPFLVRLYLSMPFLFPIFGKQMFLVVVK